jgi:four helix bundle protein
MQERNPEKLTRTSRTVEPAPLGALSHHRLLVWHKALALVRAVKASPVGDAELRDQATRACRSAALNIAEASALEGAAKRRHFGIARASAVETAAAYELARALGETVDADEVVGLAAEVAAMLTALLR